MSELYQVDGNTYTLSQIEEIAFKAIKGDSFEEGVRYALDYLHEVYGEGIEETDIWSEYMDEEEAK